MSASRCTTCHFIDCRCDELQAVADAAREAGRQDFLQGNHPGHSMPYNHDDDYYDIAEDSYTDGWEQAQEGAS